MKRRAPPVIQAELFSPTSSQTISGFDPMENPKLTPFIPAAGQPILPCWNVANIRISQTDARQILGQPHYVEDDSRATSGGTEDHWTYLSCDLSPVFFRLRVPYQMMDICLTCDIPSSNEKSWLGSLFGQIAIRYYDDPWDENVSPDSQ